MGSKHKPTRQMQKDKYEQDLAARKAALAEKGLDEKKIAKDKTVQQLQADLKRSRKALASIDAKNEIVEKARKQKEENAAQKASGESKSKKKEQKEEPDQKKGKKEKKAKKATSSPL